MYKASSLSRFDMSGLYHREGIPREKTTDHPSIITSGAEKAWLQQPLTALRRTLSSG